MGKDEFEMFLVQLYANIELLGGLFLGSYSKFVEDKNLKCKLVWHSGEEVRHSLILNELIKDSEINPLKVDYSRTKDFPLFIHTMKNKDLIEFLIRLHIYESRVPLHYKLHVQWSDNEDVKKILNQLIKEEDSHLSWVKDFLLSEQEKGNLKVKELIRKLYQEEVDFYPKDMEIFEDLSEEGKEFVEFIKENSKGHDKIIKDYLWNTFNINDE